MTQYLESTKKTYRDIQLGDLEVQKDIADLKTDDTRRVGIDYPKIDPKFIWDNDIREDRKAGWT